MEGYAHEEIPQDDNPLRNELVKKGLAYVAKISKMHGEGMSPDYWMNADGTIKVNLFEQNQGVTRAAQHIFGTLAAPLNEMVGFNNLPVNDAVQAYAAAVVEVSTAFKNALQKDFQEATRLAELGKIVDDEADNYLDQVKQFKAYD